MTLRIAMWSGPRNISTAMMRAWGNRGDCAVSDEPLYAAYLAETGLDHPGREAVIAAGETDWRRVVDALLGPAPQGATIWYQKHMSHHLLPGMAVDWVLGLRNVFLIRDPAEVVASYLKSRATVTPEDIGLPQQGRLFDLLRERLGEAPPVIDAGDFLRAPEAHLRALCARLGIGTRRSGSPPVSNPGARAEPVCKAKRWRWPMPAGRSTNGCAASACGWTEADVSAAAARPQRRGARRRYGSALGCAHVPAAWPRARAHRR
jgi:Sulfotransferase domain